MALPGFQIKVFQRIHAVVQGFLASFSLLFLDDLLLKLSKHGKSYLGTLRGRDLEMAKQLSEHTRLVDKKGRNQVSFKDMEEQNALYMKDVFTSMVDAHWYYVLIAFFASFFGKLQSFPHFSNFDRVSHSALDAD